jgi:anti-sigma factor RsiW
MLPEYMHGKLGATQRAMVDVHLAQCEECAAELATLERVRRAFALDGTVDTASIVRALPRPPVRHARRPIVTRPVLMRLAAAISFIAVAGVSASVGKSYFGRATGSALESVSSVGAESATVAMLEKSGTASTLRGLAGEGDLADFETDDFASLIGALETVEAAPSAEPEEILVQQPSGSIEKK